jgi:Na+-transporting NADH:ubiquinone oxidoreductase subunit NqrD
MVSPPAAFFIIGGMIYLFKKYKGRRDDVDGRL